MWKFICKICSHDDTTEMLTNVGVKDQSINRSILWEFVPIFRVYRQFNI